MDTEDLIQIAEERLNNVRIENWSPDWLKEANTAALIAIAKELKRMNNLNEERV